MMICFVVLGGCTYQMEIKNCAVVFLDVVDYSLLMSRDQLGTHERFSSLKDEILVPIVGKNSGRVMRLLGDGVLLEFGDGVDAVRFVTEFQEAMYENEIEQEAETLIRFRIGANYGEVLYDAGEVYGTEVNIAARLEAIAPSGGILLSDALYDLLDDELARQFTFGGNQQLKNIDRDVSVWSWKKSIDRSGNLVEITPAEVKRPVVAVLPFDNFGGNIEDDYFVDGLTEDLITRLAYSRVIGVVGRNSTFHLRQRPRDMQKIGQMLDAKYILEGSVRRSKNKIRINTHLLESATGIHVWAQTYNEEYLDIFDTQDKITEEITLAINPAITSEEIRKSLKKSPGNLDAWDHVLHGLSELNKYEQNRNVLARQHLMRAIDEDSGFAFAHALLARSHFADGYFSWTANREVAFKAAYTCAIAAVDCDAQEVEGHNQLVFSGLIMRDYEQALQSADKAISLNPASATSNFAHGLTNLYAGSLDRAIEDLRLAQRLSPADPLLWLVNSALGLAYYCKRDFDKALEIARRCREARHGFVSSNFILAISYAQLGMMDKAKQASEILSGLSDERAEALSRTPFRDKDRLDFVRDGLKKAGW